MKEETFTYTLTRVQAEKAAAGAHMLAQIASQQTEKVPDEKLGEHMDHIKDNRALVNLFAAPLIAADEKKAAAGPLANPPPKQPRADRRRAAAGKRK